MKKLICLILLSGIFIIMELTGILEPVTSIPFLTDEVVSIAVIELLPFVIVPVSEKLKSLNAPSPSES